MEFQSPIKNIFNSDHWCELDWSEDEIHGHHQRSNHWIPIATWEIFRKIPWGRSCRCWFRSRERVEDIERFQEGTCPIRIRKVALIFWSLTRILSNIIALSISQTRTYQCWEIVRSTNHGIPRSFQSSKWYERVGYGLPAVWRTGQCKRRMVTNTVGEFECQPGNVLFW